MLLYDISENSAGVISALHFDKTFAKRLRDMGFCEGERVLCVKRAALGTPVLYKVKGTDIALRKGDAKRIEVTL